MALTDAGARYLERVRRILGDVEEAESAVEGEHTRPGGRLVVSAPVGFGRLHVSPVMSAYLKRYPEVSGELRLSDQIINLVEDGVDLAIRIGHLAGFQPGGASYRRDAADRGGLPRLSRGARRAEDAGGHRFARHHPVRRHRGLAGLALGRKGREIRIACTPRLTTNSSDAAIQYAEQDGGLTRVMAYQADASIRAGRLKIVLAKFEPPPLPIHIVYPTSRLLSAKVRSFIDLVIETSDWHFGEIIVIPGRVRRCAVPRISKFSRCAIAHRFALLAPRNDDYH